ncbi:hypothetical protein D3C75_1069760 [compost metagenome]
MAFNITIVAFDKEPDTSEEKILDYRGFDPVLVGQTTNGGMHFYTVKTEVPGADIRHVQIRDELIDSPNMVLVFENLVPQGGNENDPIPEMFNERLSGIIKETVLRLGVTDVKQLEGPWFAGGVMAYTVLDVGKALSDDLAKAERSAIFKGNKHD